MRVTAKAQSLQNRCRETGQPHAKERNYHCLTHTQKLTQTWIKDLHGRPEAIKFLE